MVPCHRFSALACSTQLGKPRCGCRCCFLLLSPCTLSSCLPVAGVGSVSIKKSTPFICRKITHYTTLYYIYKYFIFMAGFIVRFSYVPFSAALASNISCSRLNRLYITMKVTGIAAIIRGVVKELNVQVLCVSSLKLFHSSQYLFLCTPYAPDLRTPLGLRKKTRGKKEKGAKNHQNKM